MRNIITIALLTMAACPSIAATPLPPAQYQAMLGTDAYALVLRTFGDPKQDVLKSDVCVKRDAACYAMLQGAEQFHYATVLIYDDVGLNKVFVPVSERVSPGDIIQIRIASDPRKVPMFVKIGARKELRSVERCDWIDGSPLNQTGGIACDGWSYKKP